MVEDALSEEILLGHVKLGDRVLATVKDGELAFQTVCEITDMEQEMLPAAQPNID